jgi:hypothetical protein
VSRDEEQETFSGSGTDLGQEGGRERPGYVLRLPLLEQYQLLITTPAQSSSNILGTHWVLIFIKSNYISVLREEELTVEVDSFICKLKKLQV